jgi:hypothetical protein
MSDDVASLVLSALNVRAPDARKEVDLVEFTCVEDEGFSLSDEPTTDLIQFIIDWHDDSSSPMSAKTACRDALSRTWFAAMGAQAAGDLDHALHHLATGDGWTLDGQDWRNAKTPYELCSMLGFWSATYSERKAVGDIDGAAKALTKWATAFVALRYAMPVRNHSEAT